MMQSFESVIESTVARLHDFIELHRRSPSITLADHVLTRRQENAARISAKELIYLDTNAWKCMADYRLRKSTLKPAMVAFGEALEDAIRIDKFIFPIGLPTFFELDSMTDPETQSSLTDLVDGMSNGFCISPFQDRAGQELLQLRNNTLQTSNDLSDFLCSPIELLGIPVFSPPEFMKKDVDEVTFNKAFFDSVSALPFSFQLQAASSAPGPKWDNSSGISDLNNGKYEHQSEVVNLNTGIFLELKGCIATWFDQEGVKLNPQDIGLYALNALDHWHQNPTSRALPTLRILSSLYGLMRFDSARKYHDGDPNDFMVAASALPVAHALFTDKKLANLLADSRIGLKKFSNCTVISGFDEMANYLAKRL